ncbi:MAG TPA: peptidoglycan DD-metalloendopeptidase family protein [Solirubrobacterales bacterium]|nr:peptidoglycan DD-metalloendopeptidase family protein [Solirubrobacterales bacterium]
MAENGCARASAAGLAATIAALVASLCLAAAATAATGGAPTPSGSPPPPSSPSGTPSSAPSAGAITLLSAETTPRKSFYFGYRFPRLTYTIGSGQPQNDLRIDVVSASGEVVKTYYRNDVAPDAANSVRWDGTDNEGKPARNGRYSFRVSPQGTEVAARVATEATSPGPGFAFYGYAFPILGPHEFGMSAGRFGAGRSGHTHQGQDTMAACGTPLVAARGGVVQYAGYQSAAGNYVVIDGKGTAYDFMYAHMAEPSPLHTGETVRTGQPIGIVGDTGDAQGCHLHFEMWTAPGWYEGGSPIDPLPYLQAWDRYS